MNDLSRLTPPPASFFSANAVFIGRSVRLSLRNVEALLMAVMLPVMLMLLFTYVFGGALDPSGNYVNYVVPGIILLCAGFGSSSTAVDVSVDMTNGIIDRFRTMPIHSMNTPGTRISSTSRTSPRTIQFQGPSSKKMRSIMAAVRYPISFRRASPAAAAPPSAGERQGRLRP